jgi:hypothetical protein
MISRLLRMKKLGEGSLGTTYPSSVALYAKSRPNKTFGMNTTLAGDITSGMRSSVPARPCRDPKLAGAAKYFVFQFYGGFFTYLRVGPLAIAEVLPEQGDAHTICTQLAAQDVDIHLETFIGCFGRRIPVGDYNPAERVG